MPEQTDFLKALSSGAPTPGGGGASAYIGAVSAALCSMVANLTDGKKKYAAYQEDITDVLQKTAMLQSRFLSLMEEDEAAFLPLSKAYGLPKDTPERSEILEAALAGATKVPLALMETVAELLPVLQTLEKEGSRLAVSDVGVAAAACRCAMEGAAMNIWINTRLMQNRPFASDCDRRAEALLSSVCPCCTEIYDRITGELRGQK